MMIAEKLRSIAAELFVALNIFFAVCQIEHAGQYKNNT